MKRSWKGVEEGWLISESKKYDGQGKMGDGDEGLSVGRRIALRSIRIVEHLTRIRTWLALDCGGARR